MVPVLNPEGVGLCQPRVQPERASARSGVTLGYEAQHPICLGPGERRGQGKGLIWAVSSPGFRFRSLGLTALHPGLT